MIIAVDFDGTIVEDRYPKIGAEIPFAIQTLKMLTQKHHQLILWTVREGSSLQEAIEWCQQRGVKFYAVNQNLPEEENKLHKNGSRKINADLFIDDRNFGGLPDWGNIYQIIQNGLIYKDLYNKSQRECFSFRRFWEKLLKIINKEPPTI
ncbi:MAG: hypothetical protein LKI39_12960 [Bacteroides sp.]|nr:hypothetical protein [Bacteroides sp.]MCI1683446.1 hypothetical protein [Bacteroides sp.]